MIAASSSGSGFIFIVALGTLWRARIRYTVPMLFCLAFFFNFIQADRATATLERAERALAVVGKTKPFLIVYY